MLVLRTFTRLLVNDTQAAVAKTLSVKSESSFEVKPLGVHLLRVGRSEWFVKSLNVKVTEKCRPKYLIRPEKEPLRLTHASFLVPRKENSAVKKDAVSKQIESV